MQRAFACELRMRIWHVRDLWLHQNGFVLAIHGIVASQQCRSCQYVVKRTKRSYYDESDVVL